MCGEESAVHVFHQEARRLSGDSYNASRLLLQQIAAEEIEHELLLGAIHNHLPLANDHAVLRKRAQYFFMRLASIDPATHFSRIAELDSGACIIMSALLNKSSNLSAATGILGIEIEFVETKRVM